MIVTHFQLTPIAADEVCRIRHILKRDGAEKAFAFAKQTAEIYKNAVLNKKHFASLPAYRRQFIESYLVLKYASSGVNILNMVEELRYQLGK